MNINIFLQIARAFSSLSKYKTVPPPMCTSIGKVKGLWVCEGEYSVYMYICRCYLWRGLECTFFHESHHPLKVMEQCEEGMCQL